MIAGLFLFSWLAVDLAAFQAIGGLRREHQMIDAQAFVALPAAGLVIPEGIAMALGMEVQERIGIAEADEGAEMSASLEAGEGILGPGHRIIDIVVGRDDVVVAAEEGG